MHISHYLQHPNHPYAKIPYGGAHMYGGRYPHHGFYGPRTAYSKSPGRRSKYLPGAYYDPRYPVMYDRDLDKSYTKDPTIMEISQDLDASQQKALLDAPLTERPAILDQRNSIKPGKFMKKKKTSKVPKDPWNNLSKQTSETAQVQKEKIERRKLYDMQLKRRLNDMNYDPKYRN